MVSQHTVYIDNIYWNFMEFSLLLRSQLSLISHVTIQLACKQVYHP